MGQSGLVLNELAGADSLFNSFACPPDMFSSSSLLILLFETAMKVILGLMQGKLDLKRHKIGAGLYEESWIGYFMYGEIFDMVEFDFPQQFLSIAVEHLDP